MPADMGMALSLHRRVALYSDRLSFISIFSYEYEYAGYQKCMERNAAFNRDLLSDLSFSKINLFAFFGIFRCYKKIRNPFG